MTKYIKIWVVMVLLLSAIIISFTLPKPKYISPKILSELEIPYRFNGWQGKDVAGELNLEDERFKFISEVFARVYENKYQESLLLLILDAGNFHHPKVCFSSAGFKIKELNDIEFQILGRAFKAHTLYAQKGTEGFLIVYWICIDKKMVDWTGQKIKQLWFSLFNKEKVGLMIRLDIPTREDNIDNSLKLAKEFMQDLSQSISTEQIDYILGKK